VAITARSIHSGARGDDLSFQQWRIVVVLGQVETARISELAERIGASGPSASRLVQRLRRRGIVRQEVDPDDRRAVRVSLTDQGRELRSRVVDTRRRLIQETLPGRRSARLATEVDAMAALFDRWV
jgi:DNA-binding MarR family transcriptional regulator